VGSIARRTPNPCSNLFEYLFCIPPGDPSVNIKVGRFFLSICLSGGLEDSFFAGYFPPNPQEGILDLLARASIIPVFMAVVTPFFFCIRNSSD